MVALSARVAVVRPSSVFAALAGAALGDLVAGHYPVMPGNALRSVLGPAGDELPGIVRPVLEGVPGAGVAEPPDFLGPLPLCRREVAAELVGLCALHFRLPCLVT